MRLSRVDVVWPSAFLVIALGADPGIALCTARFHLSQLRLDPFLFHLRRRLRLIPGHV